MRIYPLWATMLLSLLLAGCFAGTTGNIEPAYYDMLGGISMDSVGNNSSGSSSSLRIRQIEVQAPVWLNTPAMQYRLRYADAERRSSFAGSRWVAPPASMLELALKRHSVSTENRLEGDGCRLRVELDEFIQVFDTPDSSRALVDVRVTLLSSRNGKIMAQRRFTQAPSAGVDAKSGVVAFAGAVRSLSIDVDEWFARMVLTSPALIEYCRSTGFN